ncbi:MAG: hypothetical protein AAGA87_04290 [Pseudomonadota bacterium]
MAHVLIGYGEALPAPEVVFSLRAAGHRVSVFSRTDALPLKRLQLEGFHVVTAPEDDLPQAEADIRALMDKADLILPLDDPALFVASRALAGDDRVAGATGRQAEIALNKVDQIRAADAARLSVPPTWVIDPDLSALTAAAEGREPPFPAIAKPALAGKDQGGTFTRGDAQYLDGADDLTRLLADPGRSPILIQPLVHGTGEGVFGHRTASGVQAWSGHRRLRMMNPHGSGSSACQSMMPDPALRERIEDFLSRINWRGPFMVELLRDPDGTPQFMELNGRMWGSMALARRQGLEYPAWAIARALGEEPETYPEASTGLLTVRHLGRDLLHLAFTLKGPKSDFHRETWPVFGRSLIGVFAPAPARHFYNHDPSARGFVLRDAAWTVRKVLSR